MIEAITYRWYDHAGFSGARMGEDGAMRIPYRTDDEVRGWITRDPINRYRTWLLDKGLVSEAEINELVASVRQAVDASVDFARKGSEPDPEAGVSHTYADADAVRTQFYNRKRIVT